MKPEDNRGDEQNPLLWEERTPRGTKQHQLMLKCRWISKRCSAGPILVQCRLEVFRILLRNSADQVSIGACDTLYRAGDSPNVCIGTTIAVSHWMPQCRCAVTRRLCWNALSSVFVLANCLERIRLRHHPNRDEQPLMVNEWRKQSGANPSP